MKVLFVHNSSQTFAKLRGELCHQMIQSGWQIHIAVPDDDREAMQSLVDRGAHITWIPLDRTGSSLSKDLTLLRSLRSLMLIITPEIIFLTTIKPVIYGTFAAKLSRSKAKIVTLMTGLGYIFQSPQSLKDAFIQTLARILQRTAFQMNDFILFQNQNDLDQFKALGLGSSKTKRLLVGSGVDLQCFKEAPLPEGETVFLMASRLLTDKGLREYLQAADTLKSKKFKAQFLLAGPFDSNPRALKARELEPYIRSGSIEYLGVLSDIQVGIRRAHIVVLPSYREGIPRILLEALAMNRGIITTDAPGCTEFGQFKNEYIEIIPVKDPKALEEAMKRLATNYEHKNTRPLTRKIAEDFFNAEIVNKKIMAIVSQ